jgi:hypothetical protein
MDLAEKFVLRSYLSFKFFVRCEIQRKSFLCFGYTTAEEIFSGVGYNGRGFSLVWGIPQNNFKMFNYGTVVSR